MNKNKVSQLQKLLAELDPGYLPEPIFWETTRLTVSGILELVPLRKNGDVIEVLSLKRRGNDPHWPGMSHTPGTVLRPTDSDDFKTAMERVFDEIGRKYSKYSPKYIKTVFHDVNRGKELAVIYGVVLTDIVETDNWVKLTGIEDKLVSTQVEFIQAAAESIFK